MSRLSEAIWYPSGSFKEITLALQTMLGDWCIESQPYYFARLDELWLRGNPPTDDRFTYIDYYLSLSYGIAEKTAIVSHLDDVAIVFLPEAEFIQRGIELPAWPSRPF